MQLQVFERETKWHKRITHSPLHTDYGVLVFSRLVLFFDVVNTHTEDLFCFNIEKQVIFLLGYSFRQLSATMRFFHEKYTLDVTNSFIWVEILSERLQKLCLIENTTVWSFRTRHLKRRASYLLAARQCHTPYLHVLN